MKVLRSVFKVKGNIFYNEDNGNLLFEDVIMNENHLALHLIDKRITKDKITKGYTISPNNSYDTSLPSLIRCQVSQTSTDFQSYQIHTTFGFAFNFPNEYKQAARDAFIEWQNASQDKFIFNETTLASSHIKIHFLYSSSSIQANATYPFQGANGYTVGDYININRRYFHPLTGLFASLPLQDRINRFKSTMLHEIGHSLGLAHFHDAVEEGAYHVNGTAQDNNQNDVSIMGYYNTQSYTSLFIDDINTIRTLYPYTGNGSQICNSNDVSDNILTDEYYMPLALCDVNADGRSSSLDLILLQRVILGYTTTLSDYGIQKGAAIHPNNTAALTVQDLIQLQDYILGYDLYTDPITSNQWVALADADLNGVLDSIDVITSDLDACPYLDVARASFTTEMQSSCSLIAGYSNYLARAECIQWKEAL